jgi:hypothetical protein
MDVRTAKHKRPKEKTIVTAFTIDSKSNIVAHAEGFDKTPENQQPVRQRKGTGEARRRMAASRVMEVWKSFTGVTPFPYLKPVKKFTDRKIAVRRI